MERTGNMSPLFTHSQELDLLTDHEVGSVMKLLDMGNEHHQGLPQQSVQQHILHNNFDEYNIVYESDQYNIDRNTQNTNDANEINSHVECLLPPALPPPLTKPTLLVAPTISVLPQTVSKEDYAGPFKFEVTIDPHCQGRNPWVYSAALNKIYIGMSSLFPVDFHWNSTGTLPFLFVRATPTFSLAQHAHELVMRCLAHSMSMDPSNRDVPEHIWHHVIRCQNTKAQYNGSKTENIQYNVSLPLQSLQADSSSSCRELYMFVCKNSCPSGMNRKPFEVIFTLEDEKGFVYGRRKLNVRVCSCPKRDRDKEEKDFMKEQQCGARSNKKRKLEKSEEKPPPNNTTTDDTKVYSVNIEIYGKQNLLAALKMCEDLMAAEVYRQGPLPQLVKCVEKLATKRKNYE